MPVTCWSNVGCQYLSLSLKASIVPAKVWPLCFRRISIWASGHDSLPKSQHPTVVFHGISTCLTASKLILEKLAFRFKPKWSVVVFPWCGNEIINQQKTRADPLNMACFSMFLSFLKMEFEGQSVVLKFHFKVPFLQSCFLNDQYSSSFHVIGTQMKIKYLRFAPEELNTCQTEAAHV